MSDRTKSLLATGSSSNDYLSVLHELTIGQFRGCGFSGGLFRSVSADSMQTIGQHGQESALHVLICLLNEFRVTSLASSLVYRQPERVVSHNRAASSCELPDVRAVLDVRGDQ